LDDYFLPQNIFNSSLKISDDRFVVIDHK